MLHSLHQQSLSAHKLQLSSSRSNDKWCFTASSLIPWKFTPSQHISDHLPQVYSPTVHPRRVKDFTSCCGQSCSSINWIVQKFFNSFNILQSSAISSQCWCHIIGKTAWLVMWLTTKDQTGIFMICWHRVVSAFYQSVFSEWRFIVNFVKLIPTPSKSKVLMNRQRVLQQLVCSTAYDHVMTCVSPFSTSPVGPSLPPKMWSPMRLMWCHERKWSLLYNNIEFSETSSAAAEEL